MDAWAALLHPSRSLMPSSKRPPANESPGGTIVVGSDADDETVATEPIAPDDQVNSSQRQMAPTAETPEYGDEAPGATAFVRFDAQRAPTAPLPPPRRGAEQPVAPRKGLQVTLPDDEPAPPPPPKRIVAPSPDKKGRRGNWWDAKSEKLPAEDAPPPEPEPPPQPGARARGRHARRHGVAAGAQAAAEARAGTRAVPARPSAAVRAGR